MDKDDKITKQDSPPQSPGTGSWMEKETWQSANVVVCNLQWAEWAKKINPTNINTIIQEGVRNFFRDINHCFKVNSIKDLEGRPVKKTEIIKLLDISRNSRWINKELFEKKINAIFSGFEALWDDEEFFISHPKDNEINIFHKNFTMKFDKLGLPQDEWFEMFEKYFINVSELSEQNEIDLMQYYQDYFKINTINKLNEKKISKTEMIHFLRDFRQSKGETIPEEQFIILFPILITISDTDQLCISRSVGYAIEHYIVSVYDKNGKDKRGFRIGLDGNPENRTIIQPQMKRVS